MIQTDILVVGGGLSGLMAAWQLNHAGTDTILLEARERFGGRAYTEPADGATCDLGPSWFWDGQPLIATLIEQFGLSYFEQYSDGSVLIEQPNGAVIKSHMLSPMLGSRRIVGGMSQLVQAISQQIPESKRLLGHELKALKSEDNYVIATVENAEGETQIRANHIALAIPLRLAANINFTPALSVNVIQTLTDTPTWMAGHAKFFAVYDTPFWRENGLCGTALSRRGPLAEIHDASLQTGDVYSLFGFIGFSAEQRAQLGEEQLTELAINQLVNIFGEEARTPKATYLQDWSAEPYTASHADQQPQTRHPDYGVKLDLDDEWSDKVSFIVSETAPSNTGLVEGALEAGLSFAKRFMKNGLSVIDEEKLPHTASMDWDWLTK